jgi:Tol biopolymer transport system component
VPVGGGEPVPFVANPFDDFSPQFSPDGSQVLFTSVGGSQTDLWVMPSAGGPASALTNGTSSAG